jgi:SAM-dependent methyltransferase
MSVASEIERLANDTDKYHTKERRELLRFVPVTCRTLLDVGCASAQFGALLKQERDIEVWGVEVDPGVASVASTKIDRVINAYFSSDIELPDSYFDAITFNDCLEHFPDPFPPLALAKRKLKPGGTLICSLPNVRYADNLRHLILEMDWKYEEWGVRDKTHLRFFTRKSMIRTIEEAGYSIISVDGINASDYYLTDFTMQVLRVLFRKWTEDMRYQQFVIVAGQAA